MGTKVKIINTFNDEWLKIKLVNGQEGWISKNEIKIEIRGIYNGIIILLEKFSMTIAILSLGQFLINFSLSILSK